jgi:hypothetical protein
MSLTTRKSKTEYRAPSAGFSLIRRNPFPLYKEFDGLAVGALARHAASAGLSILLDGALPPMHDAMAEDPHVRRFITVDGLPAAHALRKHRVDRPRELLDGGIGGA